MSGKIKITKEELKELYDITDDEVKEDKKEEKSEWDVTIEDGDKELEENLDW